MFPTDDSSITDPVPALRLKSADAIAAEESKAGRNRVLIRAVGLVALAVGISGAVVLGAGSTGGSGGEIPLPTSSVTTCADGLENYLEYLAQEQGGATNVTKLRCIHSNVRSSIPSTIGRFSELTSIE
jgi:hypothetical protein